MEHGIIYPVYMEHGIIYFYSTKMNYGVCMDKNNYVQHCECDGYGFCELSLQQL